jgi:hypothetical protein
VEEFLVTSCCLPTLDTELVDNSSICLFLETEVELEELELEVHPCITVDDDPLDVGAKKVIMDNCLRGDDSPLLSDLLGFCFVFQMRNSFGILIPS